MRFLISLLVGLLSVSASFAFDAKTDMLHCNGADWSRVCQRFQEARAGRGVFSVVCIGDSHTQADFGLAVLRDTLQAMAGSAGRGLIVPLRAAGTNQPLDYTFDITPVSRARVMIKDKELCSLPFTGTCVYHDSDSCKVRIGATKPFRSVCINLPADTIIHFEEPQTEAEFSLSSGYIHSAVLRSDSAGVFVHGIGNNGATFASYLAMPSFAENLVPLHPDMIVLALGTNDTFSRATLGEIEDNANALLDKLTAVCPDAMIVIVGPAHCLKKATRRIRTKRDIRKRTIKVENDKAAMVSDLLKDIASSKRLPYFETYSIGFSALDLQSSKLLSKDGVHFTPDGYRQMAALFVKALCPCLVE